MWSCCVYFCPNKKVFHTFLAPKSHQGGFWEKFFKVGILGTRVIDRQCFNCIFFRLVSRLVRKKSLSAKKFRATYFQPLGSPGKQLLKGIGNWRSLSMVTEQHFLDQTSGVTHIPLFWLSPRKFHVSIWVLENTLTIHRKVTPPPILVRNFIFD